MKAERQQPAKGGHAAARKRAYALGLVALAGIALAQQAAPPQAQPAKPPAAGAQNPPAAPAPAQPAPAQAAPAQPAPAQPAQPQPAQPAAPQATAPAAGTGAGLAAGALGGLNFYNVALSEVIDILAQKLKINYILDPRVKGSVTINTYGEIKPVDVRQLLDTILRINNAAIVQVGDLYRIVPTAEVSRLPIKPRINGKELPDGEEMILNLIFLKYATVGEISKILGPFLGEGSVVQSYDPANLLIIMDNARSMRRTMDLVAMFDSDSMASQRVRLFEVENGRPSDLAKELETVFKAVGLSEKVTAVRFMPIDRINTIIAVAPNPGVFEQVENWIRKLDIPVKATAGAVDNYVYRLKYGCADTVATAVMQLYGGIVGYPGMYGGGYGGYGGMYGGGYGGYGGGYGGYGGYGYGGGGYGQTPGTGCGGTQGGGYGYGGGYGGYGGMGGYAGGIPGLGAPGLYGNRFQQPATPNTQAPNQPPTAADLTGMFLGGAPMTSQIYTGPRVIPNPFDNTLLVQGTPKEWDQIKRLIDQIDIPPRQVLIEARIYEVNLTGAFSAGVSAALQKKNATAGSDDKFPKLVTGTANAAGLSLTAGVLVGQSRELLGLLSAQEDNRKTKVISAPSVIATDSIPALINVGVDVPVLNSQAISPIQSGGSSLFTNTVSSRSAGVQLNITARVNSSGVVTLQINQEVSTAQQPAAGAAIQSPSFQRRNVTTQVTVEDGDTIAIGGIIQESDGVSTSGVPYLSRIPILGTAFGAKSVNKQRTELVVFMTPRVIYDTNQIVEASDDLKSQFKRLRKMYRE